MSCQLGRETRGTVLEAASEVGLALSSAASVWSSVGAAREHRIFCCASRVRDNDELSVGARDARVTKRKTEGPQHFAFPEISRENSGCLVDWCSILETRQFP